jgi:hypothetical protein
MKSLLCFATVACAVVAATIASTSAHADGPFCDSWCGGINYPFGLYGNRINDVPYFAMFPPVYYSAPVARTYGFSPFAYPPGVMTPEVVQAPAPQEIINPHIPQKPPTKPSSADSAHTAENRTPRPQTIINPFVHVADSSPDASTSVAAQ